MSNSSRIRCMSSKDLRVRVSRAIPTRSTRKPISGPSRAECAPAIPTGRWWPLTPSEATAILPPPRPIRAILALALITLLSHCKEETKAPPTLTLAAVAIEDLPGWGSDEMGEALPALLKSCASLVKLEPHTAVGPGGIAGTAGDWRMVCAEAASTASSRDGVRRFMEARFAAFRAANHDEAEGLFTGYYEPELKGARSRSTDFTVPLLKRPPDLVMVDLGQFRPAWRGERTAGRVVNGKLHPYESRAEIEKGALDRFHLELVWVADPADAFFLEIQGSGQIVLPDGSHIRIGYDGQ